MKRTGEVKIRIQRDVGDPDAGELAEYLMLLRSLYNAGLAVERSGEVFEGSVFDWLRSQPPRQINAMLQRKAGRDAMRTRRVSHESPVEIILSCVIQVAAVAIVISGGKFKIPGVFEFGLPYGLGHSIEQLRKAFAKKGNVTLGFGVRERTIKLLKKEFTDLMAYVEKGRGGFQRFLVSLQYRVNRKTRELTLSSSDIDTIMKYGSKPKAGGFQAYIRRVFNSHFDWPDK